MLTRDEALNVLEMAIRCSSADQTEVMLHGSEHGLTRLANGSIHQNVHITNLSAHVRAVVGKRVGVATSNRLSGDGLRALVERAVAVAKVSEPNAEFDSLPGPGEYVFSAGTLASPVPDIDEDAFSPTGRADAALTIINTARGNGATAFGHVSTDVSMLAVGNSLGVRAHHAWTACSVMAIATLGDASGYAQWSGQSLVGAPTGGTAAHAVSKCLAAEAAGMVEPGRYTVILEPPAVAEMLGMLAYMGLGATQYQEGRSFLSGKLGENLVGENITLRDDTYHPLSIPLPFDFEGVPRRVVPFFESGVAKGVVYDSYTARKEGRESTGHALPAPNTYGPIPLHLVLEGGAQTREELIACVERGILVTRFHYVNIVHPTEAIITGMTRDGTFLIEDGAVTKAVNKLRFTQSILEALSRVSGLERALTLVSGEGMHCVVPALRIEDFNFTSASPE
ncbi:MAG: protease TldD [bacterium ADurb.Bin429]|nr:MAG: protease TldD [bacterium ADurb.Bin429]